MECPISKADFVEHAEDIVMLIEEKPVELHPKEFSTGSFGWNASGKMKVSVRGVPLTVQISANATVLKSKEAPSKSAVPLKKTGTKAELLIVI